MRVDRGMQCEIHCSVDWGLQFDAMYLNCFPPYFKFTFERVTFKANNYATPFQTLLFNHHLAHS